jgi:hypothetical protein
VPRKFFGPKLKKVGGNWRKLHNEKLHDLHTSPDIMTIVKQKRMRWVTHTAHMEEYGNA